MNPHNVQSPSNSLLRVQEIWSDFTRKTGFSGWISPQIATPIFRETLEKLLTSRWTEPPFAVSRDRETYRIALDSAAGEHVPAFGDVYVKCYHVRGFKPHLESFLRVHKAQKAWRIGRNLVRRSIATPAPLAYFTRRNGVFITEHVLITAGIPNGVSLANYAQQELQPLAEYPRDESLRQKKRLLIRIAADFLGKLHHAGIYHGDFTAQNILIDSESLHAYLIDLDAIRSTRRISFRRRMKNLDELGRNFSDLRVINIRDRARFLRRYLKAYASERRTYRDVFIHVLRRTAYRLQKHQQQFVCHESSERNFSDMLPLRGSWRQRERDQWHLFVFPAWRDIFPALDEVLAALNHPFKILQEHNRGIVFLVQHRGVTFVARRSYIQERKRWAQFTSLYRRGEGARTLHNMGNLFASGVPVPEPVLVLEKKRFGFTVSSWTLYQYVEGEPCTCDHADRVAAILKMLHQQGWVHRDPHIQNFLWDGQNIHIIDCARARPWSSQYARMYDVVLLNKCCPGSAKYYGISDTDAMYRLAQFQNTLIRLWRRIKRKVRRHS